LINSLNDHSVGYTGKRQIGEFEHNIISIF